MLFIVPFFRVRETFSLLPWKSFPRRNTRARASLRAGVSAVSQTLASHASFYGTESLTTRKTSPIVPSLPVPVKTRNFLGFLGKSPTAWSQPSITTGLHAEDRTADFCQAHIQSRGKPVTKRSPRTHHQTIRQLFWQ